MRDLKRLMIAYEDVTLSFSFILLPFLKRRDAKSITPPKISISIGHARSASIITLIPFRSHHPTSNVSIFRPTLQSEPIPSHPIITTPTCNHPSAYAAPCITNASKSAPIGTTAPCRTGFARIGVRRLGNRAGSRACRAAPRVCEGAIGDWTTRRV